MLTLLALVIVLGPVIVFHEIGHFLVAKLAGIYVKTFSVGFGPKLLKLRLGETQYALSAVPLGGYVKMAGDSAEQEEEEEDEDAAGAPEAASGDSSGVPGASAPRKIGEEMLYSTAGDPTDADIPPQRWFRNKPLVTRLAVVVAGPFFNLILAIVIMTGVLYKEGTPVWHTTTLADVAPESDEFEAGLRTGDVVEAIAGQPVENTYEMAKRLDQQDGKPFPVRLRRGERDTTIVLPGVKREKGIVTFPMLRPRFDSRVGNVKKDGPAWRAGLRPGDRITAIDGQPIEYYDQIADLINPAIGRELTLTWQRDGQALSARVTPEAAEVPVDGSLTKTQKIGRIQVERYSSVMPVSFGSALGYSFEYCWIVVRETGRLLGVLVRGQGSRDAIGGPIRIAQESGSALRWGFSRLFNLLAYLSINLFLLNLLPIPVLDGGHVLFLVIEAVRGEALSLRMQERLLKVGVSALILLMGYVVFNDLVRLLAH